jgi:hypothetical protein
MNLIGPKTQWNTYVARRAQIRKSIRGGNSSRGPDTEWVVMLYENDQLIERRCLGDHNIHFAEDVKENWENGIIPSPKN